MIRKRHHSHKVVTHKWVNGNLETQEHFVSNYELAKSIADGEQNDMAKIYDLEDNLVYQTTQTVTNSYA